MLANIDRKAWARFFLAIAGLALAFAAAIFSTVFRENGNVLGTAVSASVALLTAGAVALYAVPYLARRAALETVRDAFHYDVTREGAVYLALALLIGVAGLNTGNNLLFIVLSAMLAAVVVSGFASATVLRGLQLEVSLPAHVFAGQALMARLYLRNRNSLPSFSVSVASPKARSGKRYAWRRGVFEFPSRRFRREPWLRLPDLQLRAIAPQSSPDVIFRGSAYFPFITAKGAAHADVHLNFPRRGRYAQDEFGLSTRFPFSFLRKTRTVALSREIIVYPAVDQTDDFFAVLPMITGEFEAFVRGRGYDLYRIRECTPVDSARMVDWKATAKSGNLMVREFTREDERKLRIVFDNPPPGTVRDDDYEAAVSLTASLAWHFANSAAQLSFAASGYHASNNIYDFLKYLALVQPEASASVMDGLHATGDYNLIITARPRGSVPTELWSSAYLLFMGGRPRA